MSCRSMLQQCNSQYRHGAVVWKNNRCSRDACLKIDLSTTIRKRGRGSVISFVYAVDAFWGSAARGEPKKVLNRLGKWDL